MLPPAKNTEEMSSGLTFASSKVVSHIISICAIKLEIDSSNSRRETSIRSLSISTVVRFLPESDFFSSSTSLIGKSSSVRSCPVSSLYF